MRLISEVSVQILKLNFTFHTFSWMPKSLEDCLNQVMEFLAISLKQITFETLHLYSTWCAIRISEVIR